MHFFVSQLGKSWDWKKDGIILKKNTVEYHSPGLLEDELMIQVTCSHIGSKSFTLAYQIFNQNHVLRASGESVLVCFNYLKGKTVEVPEIFVKILKLHQTL
jgi:acyl-CoA thioester hydrolase